MTSTLNLTDALAVASFLISLATLAKVFFGVAYTLASLQVKVDTMWDFTIRRGKIEAVEHGFAKLNSPLIFTPEAVKIIEPFVPRLRQLYEETEPIADHDLAVIIERTLGEVLLKEVCIPNGIYMGACLVLAIEAAKGKLNGEHHVAA